MSTSRFNVVLPSWSSESARNVSDHPTNYAFDNAWAKARERLAALERIEDPATIEYLTRIGVATGWSCLEVGAGGDSIAKWLCERVGADGYVVATDSDTRFLTALSYPQLQVRQENVATARMEVNRFDLVHTRNLLIHLPKRMEVLEKMVRAAKPGGWVLIEESDFVTNQAQGRKRASRQRSNVREAYPFSHRLPHPRGLLFHPCRLWPSYPRPEKKR